MRASVVEKAPRRSDVTALGAEAHAVLRQRHLKRIYSTRIRRVARIPAVTPGATEHRVLRVQGLEFYENPIVELGVLCLTA